MIWKTKTKAKALLELIDSEGGRYMLEHTDEIGGHLVNGDRKCTV